MQKFVKNISIILINNTKEGAKITKITFGLGLGEISHRMQLYVVLHNETRCRNHCFLE